MRISAPKTALSGPDRGRGMRLELSPDGQEIVLHIPMLVLSGGLRACPECGKVNVQTFTVREKELFEYLRAGKANKEIAAHIHVSERTVKFHLSNVYRKLGVSGRLEAMRFYG